MKRLITTAFLACALLAGPVMAQTPGEEHHAAMRHEEHKEHREQRRDHRHDRREHRREHRKDHHADHHE